MAGLTGIGKLNRQFASKKSHVFRLELALLIMSVMIICLNGAAYRHWSQYTMSLYGAYHAHTYYGIVPSVLKQLGYLFFIAPAFSAFRSLFQVILISLGLHTATSFVTHWINAVFINLVYAVCYVPQTVIMGLFIHDGGYLGAPSILAMISTLLCAGMSLTYTTYVIIALCTGRPFSSQVATEATGDVAYGDPCKLCGQPTLVKPAEGVRTPEPPCYPGSIPRTSTFYDAGHDALSDITFDKTTAEKSHDSVELKAVDADSPSLGEPPKSSKSFWDMSLHEICKDRKDKN